jgi:hypothetical protein
VLEFEPKVQVSQIVQFCQHRNAAAWSTFENS